VSLILASGSPRRRQLMAALGVTFSVVVPEVREAPLDGETPVDFARRAAQEKGGDIARRASADFVLSADTVVSIDGKILGKPPDLATAADMLRSLSGRVHSVYTAVTVIRRDGASFGEVDQTRVWFRELAEGEIDRYVRTEAVMDKAGAYAIQGSARRFVPRIAGNYTNVVGLPLPVVFDLLKRAGRMV